MTRRLAFQRLGWLAVLGLLVVADRTGRADDGPRDASAVEEVLVDDAAAGPRPRLVRPRPHLIDDLDRQPPQSAFWLGLSCRPVPAPLRAQLGLDEKQGLVVDEVVPDGPAAAAGLAQFDVLLRAGEQPLADIADLATAVNEVGEQPLAIELIRGGQRQTIEVAPARRPDAPPRRPRGDAERMLRGYLQRLGLPEGVPLPPMGNLRLRMPGPPMVFDFPEDLKLIITKEGNVPATLVVSRSDETWEVTEDTLADLPDDIRPHVELFLGRLPLPDVLLGPDGPLARPEVRELLRRVEARDPEARRELGELLQRIEAEVRRRQAEGSRRREDAEETVRQLEERARRIREQLRQRRGAVEEEVEVEVERLRGQAEDEVERLRSQAEDEVERLRRDVESIVDGVRDEIRALRALIERAISGAPADQPADGDQDDAADDADGAADDAAAGEGVPEDAAGEEGPKFQL